MTEKINVRDGIDYLDEHEEKRIDTAKVVLGNCLREYNRETENILKRVARAEGISRKQLVENLSTHPTYESRIISQLSELTIILEKQYGVHFTYNGVYYANIAKIMDFHYLKLVKDKGVSKSKFSVHLKPGILRAFQINESAIKKHVVGILHEGMKGMDDKFSKMGWHSIE